MVKILKSPRGYKKQLIFVFNWLYGYLRLKKKVIVSIKKFRPHELGEYTWLDRWDDCELSVHGPCHFIVINKDAITHNNKTIDSDYDIISITRIIIHEMYHAFQQENKMVWSDYGATKAEVKIWNKMRKELLSIVDFVG